MRDYVLAVLVIVLAGAVLGVFCIAGYHDIRIDIPDIGLFVRDDPRTSFDERWQNVYVAFCMSSAFPLLCLIVLSRRPLGRERG